MPATGMTTTKSVARCGHQTVKDYWRLCGSGSREWKVRWPWADAKLALGHSNATVNRTLDLVRAIMRKCVNDWEWLDRAPQVRMLNKPTRRIRFLTHDEAQRLLAALPEHLADMAAFSC